MADRSGTTYEQWAAKEGIPIIHGYAVQDAYKVPLEPWQRKGGKGAFIHLEGGEGFSSAYICEIPTKVSLKPQRHLFEEMIYVLQGQGETKVWNEGGPEQTFAWHEYSLFAMPVNAWHQHRSTGNEPAKYVAVTNAPLVFNTFRNPEFIFNTNFAFRDRYNDEKDYFDGVGKTVGDTWQGGLIPDVREPKLPRTVHFGKGFGIRGLRLSGNTMGAHLGEVELGTYKKVHRHFAGAHIVIVQGTGYALMWKEWGERVKVDFRKGTMYCPPEGWWHTHCNTGTEVVRQVALRWTTKGVFPGIGKIYRSRLSLKKGGDMLEREDEHPEIRQLFEEELAKKGLKSNMTSIWL